MHLLVIINNLFLSIELEVNPEHCKMWPPKQDKTQSTASLFTWKGLCALNLRKVLYPIDTCAKGRPPGEE